MNDEHLDELEQYDDEEGYEPGPCPYCGEMLDDLEESFFEHEHECPNYDWYWVKGYACEDQSLEDLIATFQSLVDDWRGKLESGWKTIQVDNGHIALCRIMDENSASNN